MKSWFVHDGISGGCVISYILHKLTRVLVTARPKFIANLCGQIMDKMSQRRWPEKHISKCWERMPLVAQFLLTLDIQIPCACLNPRTSTEKAFRGSKHLLTRYLGDFGCRVELHFFLKPSSGQITIIPKPEFWEYSLTKTPFWGIICPASWSPSWCP